MDFALIIVGLVVIFIYAMHIPKPSYPTGTRCLVLSCIDLRFVTTVNRFMEKTFGFNSFDYTANPGSSLSIGTGSGTLLGSGSAISTILRNGFNTTAGISVNVNGPEILCIFEHENCGYYSFKDTNTPKLSQAQLMANQKLNLAAIITQIDANSDLKTSGVSFFTEIRGYYVYLSGRVELISSR